MRQGDHATIVNRFYVAQPPRRSEPELYCTGNGGTRPPQPVVEGIDRIEIGYWLPRATGPVRASTVSLTPTQWSTVVAVEVCVVARGRRAAGARGFVDCDGKSVPSYDGRQRVALRRLVVVRNRPEAAL
jgi:type IV pilus assembly protein PilW